MKADGVSLTVYKQSLQSYVDVNKDVFDPLVRLEGPDFLYESSDYEDDKLRELEKITYKKHGFTLVFNF